MARTPTTAPPAPIQQPSPVMQPARQLTLVERIAAASNAFGDLTKDSRNDYLKSSYQKLPALLKAIKTPLIEQGVAIYTQLIKAADGGFVVRTTLALVSGDEELSSDFPVFDASTLHKIGSAVTYGTRYNLYAMLAVCPEDDDDGSHGVYGAQAAPAGLPGGVMPAQAAPWMPQAPVMQQAPMMPAPAVAYPVQPSPVLPQ